MAELEHASQDQKPQAAAADGFALKQQQQVFDPFPVADDTFGGGFVGLYDHLGGKDAPTGFVDYSSVLDVSENLGYGESSSNSSNWNEVLDGSEELRWAAKTDQLGFAEMEDEASLEHKFSLPSCQEQSLLANFDFNLEYF